MLGAPLARLTLCHHAEATARVQGKRFHSYTTPVRVRESVEWQRYSTLDTYWGSLDYWDRSDLAVGDRALSCSLKARAGGTAAVAVGPAGESRTPQTGGGPQGAAGSS
jgi:aminoglycoside 3-N-acetyltransferase